MSWLWVFFIISLAITIIFGVIAYFFDNGWQPIWILISVTFGLAMILFLVFGIMQPIQLKSEALRQIKEREQIIYQVEHLTDEKDKIKLNEWILTYNDWVNDVNISKQTYGWFSWYHNFDMSQHTIIDLV